MKKIILIDVANLFYRAFFAVPKTLPHNAVFGSASVLLSILEHCQPDFQLAFRDERGGTFRHEKCENYKAQRAAMPEDLAQQMPKIDELFASFAIPVFSKKGFEADDGIATAVRKFRSSENEILICSTDQDLFSLVQENVFILRPASRKFEKIDAQKVFEKIGVGPAKVLDFKAIAGDASDNLPGIAGIGKKGAAKLLGEFGTLQNLQENLQKVEGRNGKLLRENFDLALQTRELIELQDNLEFSNFTLARSSVANFSPEKASQFMSEMNFKMLSRRLAKMPQFATMQRENESESQLQLFA